MFLLFGCSHNPFTLQKVGTRCYKKTVFKPRDLLGRHLFLEPLHTVFSLIFNTAGKGNFQSGKEIILHSQGLYFWLSA